VRISEEMTPIKTIKLKRLFLYNGKKYIPFIRTSGDVNQPFMEAHRTDDGPTTVRRHYFLSSSPPINQSFTLLQIFGIMQQSRSIKADGVWIVDVPTGTQRIMKNSELRDFLYGRKNGTKNGLNRTREP